MDSPHFRFHAEKTFVAFGRYRQQLRLRVGRPARVSVRMGHIGSGQCEDRFDHLHDIGFGAFDRRPLRRRDDDAVIAFELHRGQVRRGLDQPRHGERHGYHAVRHADQRIDQSELRLGIQYFVDLGHFVERDLEVRFAEPEFIFHVGCKKPVAFHKFGFVAFRHAEYRIGFARNGIAQVAAREVAQPEFARLHPVPQQSRHGFVGVDAALVDVIARVAAQEVGYIHAKKRVVFRGRLHRVAECRNGVDAARTADEDFALVL